MSTPADIAQVPLESPSDPCELFDLSGKVAMVTGATRGLGLAIASGYAAAGAHVIVISRKPEACEAVASAFRMRGARADGLACHVGHWEELERLVDSVYRRFSRVDVLVNNAGMSPVYERLSAVTEELWDKVIGVNLKGPFRLCALVGERMAAAGGGAIINVSSTGSVRPSGDIVPYAAAKAGVNAMTVGLADAFGPKVRVNAIMPGPFLTSIAENWDMDALAERTETFPLRRIGDAREIFGAALYLATEASSFTTGTILAVDGGAQWSMPGGGSRSIGPGDPARPHPGRNEAEEDL